MYFVDVCVSDKQDVNSETTSALSTTNNIVCAAIKFQIVNESVTYNSLFKFSFYKIRVSGMWISFGSYGV